MPHPIASQGHDEGRRGTFPHLEVRNRSLGEHHDGLLAGDGGQRVDDGVADLGLELLVFQKAADTRIDEHLAHPR